MANYVGIDMTRSSFVPFISFPLDVITTLKVIPGTTLQFDIFDELTGSEEIDTGLSIEHLLMLSTSEIITIIDMAVRANVPFHIYDEEDIADVRKFAEGVYKYICDPDHYESWGI